MTPAEADFWSCAFMSIGKHLKGGAESAAFEAADFADHALIQAKASGLFVREESEEPNE
jgi:hypothetical protein